MPIGELFILGFFGKTVPAWLKEFAGRYGLGGVILFDYSCRTREYDNNIESPEQVQRLCAEIAALPSAPMVFIDQEGGLVRRLKESRGFAPLPSAKEFNHLAPDEKRAILTASFAEMRRLGIHYDFAPVIDVDYNPDNPNIGKIKRSYSADIARGGSQCVAGERGCAGAAHRPVPEAFSRHRRRASSIRIRSSWTFPMRFAPSRKSCSIRSRQKCSAMRCWSAMPSSGNGTGIIR